MFSRQKISGGGLASIALLFKSRKRVVIHFFVVNEFVSQCGVALKAVGGSKLRDFFRCASAGGRRILGPDSARVDSIYGRLENGIRVVTDVVFKVRSVVTNVISPDGAPILEVNYLSRRAYCGQYQRQYEDDRCPHLSAF